MKSKKLSIRTRMKYEVHGGSLHCFKYAVKTDDAFGRIAQFIPNGNLLKTRVE